MFQAREFQQRTKYRRDSLPDRTAAEPLSPPKRFPDDWPRIKLARPEKLPPVSFWEVVARRRSVREYSSAPLTMDQLSLMLWATQGLTPSGRLRLRSTPSAGARYPLETYVAATRIAGLAPGLYHWQLPEECLTQLRLDADIGPLVASACLNQTMCADAAAVFLWTAVLSRTFSRYGDRGLRYVYLDAGHVGQNLQLAATAMGLGSCNIAALFDDEVNQLLGLDGDDETIVYAASVGHQADKI